MTGGNTYHHAIRTIYRGSGFYAALAVIADLCIVAVLISPFAVMPRRSVHLPAPVPPVTESFPRPQVLPSPAAPAQQSPYNGQESLTQTTENGSSEAAIKEKESGTPENRRAETARDKPVVPRGRREAANENFVALKDFIDLRVNRGDSGRSYGVAGGSCEAEVLAAAGRPDGCLKLTYDVSAASAAMAGYSGALEGIDLSSYKLLTLEVKKMEGREPFAVEMSDGVNAAKVEINRLLSNEGYQGWQTITIPLEYFSGVRGNGRMRGKISIIFENSQGEPYAGTVFLRDIGFFKR